MSQVIYNGPSMLDGAPIIVLMTGGRGEAPSRNDKTGPIPQVWILLQSTAPHVARKTGENRSVCGGCPVMAVCYVETWQAPRSIWQAWRDGNARPFVAQHYDTIRIGAYGDPAAVPAQVWETLRRDTGARILGYTHQWHRFESAHHYAMASVESVDGARQAQAKGFRTFRIMQRGEGLQRGEILCPASKEAGYTRQCATCGACDGTARSANRPNVAIYQH